MDEILETIESPEEQEEREQAEGLKARKQRDKEAGRRRGNASTPTGHLRIGQRHTRVGKPLCYLNLPSAAMEFLGWQPNQLLTYYPTVAGELVLVLEGQLLQHVSPDYDRRADPEPIPLRGARPGSAQAQAEEKDRYWEAMATRISQKAKAERDQEQTERRARMAGKGEKGAVGKPRK